jgi:Cellulase (glycosyl hydrolase family 5)
VHIETSRRAFLSGLLGAGSLAVLAGCGDRGSGAGGSATSSALPSVSAPTISCTGGIDSANLGICYAWPDTHDGGQMINWLGEDHPFGTVTDDFAVMASMGITRVRAFCQLESVMSFDGDRFTMVPHLAANLHGVFEMAAGFGISLLPVVTESHVNESVHDLDGKFRWDLARTSQGRATYGRALSAYAREFAVHDNVVMWETQNEPYGNITWAEVPQAMGVTDEDAHEWLLVAYDAMKAEVGDVVVGFSDLEEEQQEKYRLVANPERRGALVDDCTDVYSLHIYRNETSQIADFSDVSDKPLWCVELGAYNYVDPTGERHGGQPANNDLYDEVVNNQVLQEMVPFLLDGGFDLVMPWSFANNGGMVEHLPDGSHDFKASADWMMAELTRC